MNQGWGSQQHGTHVATPRKGIPVAVWILLALFGIPALLFAGCVLCTGAGVMKAESTATSAGRPGENRTTREHATSPSETPSAEPSSKLPPDPAPILAKRSDEAPKAEAELLDNPQYAAIWESKNRDDLNLLLTALSYAFETMRTDGNASVLTSVNKALERRKVMSLFWGFSAIPVRVGTLPKDLAERLAQYLDSIEEEPHLGTWSASKGASLPKDFSALAWWVRRDNPAYGREFLAAKRQGPLRWENVKSPWLPYLAREKAALERLALMTRLTPTEGERLVELNASKLGDDPPEEIALVDLLKEYASNELRADDKYKGHIVEFSGTAGAFERGVVGGINVTIGTGKLFEHPVVHCFFEATQAAKVKSINRGDALRVRGRVEGLMMDVVIKDCEPVE